MHKIEIAARDYFGLTDDYHTAGYLLTDGTMLDFSGAHWLDQTFYSKSEITDWKKQNNIRQVDHEDIYEVTSCFKITEKISDHRKFFMTLGAIRLSPEAPGINILQDTEPTREQYKALKCFILDIQDDKNRYADTFYVDIENKYPNKMTYTMPFGADKIINDLRDYYNKHMHKCIRRI